MHTYIYTYNKYNVHTVLCGKLRTAGGKRAQKIHHHQQQQQ